MKKNILICIPSYTYGGAEIHSLNTAKALQNEEGVHVIFLAFGRKDSFQEKLENEGFKTLHFPLSDFLALRIIQKLVTLMRLTFFLKKYKFHTIFAGTEQCNLMMGLIWKVIGAKHFFWHQWSINNKNVGFWEKAVIKSKPKYIANSRACKKNIIERHVLKNVEVEIIHNSFDVNINLNQGIKHDYFTIIMTANFFPEKDHITVLKAFKLFIDKYPEEKSQLKFLGSAPGNSVSFLESKAIAFDLGLTLEDVVFLGKVSDIESVITSSDIGILSTKSEGLSNAIIEYMIFGLPVIATDIDQNREVLGNNADFLLFKFGNEIECFKKIEKLYLNPIERVKIGTENKKYAVENYSFEVYKSKIVALIYPK
jgi:glycosyltransferase involved in cell wall biosynthesis